MIKQKIKENKGITLIALIITIIIIVILASIMMATMLNSNGIIERAKYAAKVNDYASAVDTLNVKILEKKVESYKTGEKLTLSGLGNSFIDDEQISYVGETRKSENNNNTTENGSGNSGSNSSDTPTEINQISENVEYIYVMLTEYNFEFTIDKDLNITEIDGVDIDEVMSQHQTNTNGSNNNNDNNSENNNNDDSDTPEQILPLYDIVTADNYGDEVNYSVTVNDVVLDKWKIFYKDTTNHTVYLMYGDETNPYLPNETNLATNAGLIKKNEYYSVNINTDTGTRDTLINALNNSTKWSTLVRSDLQSEASAKGGIDIVRWVASWNEKDYIHLNTKYVANSGYKVSTEDNPTTNYQMVNTDTAGYANKLYFPVKAGVTGDTYAYWLASANANSSSSLSAVGCSGIVGTYNTSSSYVGLRPIIILSNKVYGEKVNNKWDIGLRADDGTVENPPETPESNTFYHNVSKNNYGDSVNYSVTANGVVLDKWKIIYKDTNDSTVYLIYGDENSPYMPNSSRIAYLAGLSFGTDSGANYSVNSTSKSSLVSKLTNKNLWTGLIRKDLQGKATAQGALDATRWVKSWNEKHMHLELNPTSSGYYIGKTAGAQTTTQSITEDTEGYADKLYFPINSGKEGTYAYWLGAESARSDVLGSDYAMCIHNQGSVSTYSSTGNYTGLRPVVIISNTVIGEKVNGVWQLSVGN